MIKDESFRLGTAIYVYCIIFRTSTSPDGNTDMTFNIDGVSVGSFKLSPDNDTAISYNQTVFSGTNLSNEPHTIMITTGLAGQKALILLDRLLYTSGEDVDPNQSTSFSVGTLSSLSPVSPTSSSASTGSSMNEGIDSTWMVEFSLLCISSLLACWIS